MLSSPTKLSVASHPYLEGTVLKFFFSGQHKGRKKRRNVFACNQLCNNKEKELFFSIYNKDMSKTESEKHKKNRNPFMNMLQQI